jgi:hypothetical protein
MDALPERQSSGFSVGIAPDFEFFMQDHVQQGAVDFHIAAVVFDEAQLPKFVHEKTDPRPSGADHLGEHLPAPSKQTFRRCREGITDDIPGLLPSEKPCRKRA